MKKLYKLILILLIVLVTAGCGEKVNKFSDEELQEIHTKEAELKNQIIGKTWHYYDEPQRAVEFLEDGTRIEYFSAGVRGADIFDDEGDSWDVKFCGFLDTDTKYLDEENNKDKALKYYDYNLVGTGINYEGKLKTWTQEIEFSGNDLILAGDKLYEGPGVIEHMPDNLSIYNDLLNHVWNIDGLTNYALFYNDGYCFMTYGVFLDGSTNGAYLYRWGYDESTNYLYLMNYYDPNSDGNLVEDVQVYVLNKEDNVYKLEEVWSNGARNFDMSNVDGEDDSAKALMNSYNSLHQWCKDNWDD